MRFTPALAFRTSRLPFLSAQVTDAACAFLIVGIRTINPSCCLYSPSASDLLRKCRWCSICCQPNLLCALSYPTPAALGTDFRLLILLSEPSPPQISPLHWHPQPHRFAAVAAWPLLRIAIGNLNGSRTNSIIPRPCTPDGPAPVTAPHP